MFGVLVIECQLIFPHLNAYIYVSCIACHSHINVVADNEALRTLDLSWNHIRKKGAVAVATSLKVCTFTYTYSVCNWLTPVLFLHAMNPCTVYVCMYVC